jgi:PTH1 family peptidyl-tRNA hydrolase
MPPFIILGLGNPGARYARTRHNLGHLVVDLLARRNGVAFAPDDVSSPALDSVETRFGDTPVLLAKPWTYMNRSGLAGAALIDRYGAEPEDLIAVYDDADLEFGRVRVRGRGGPGGHRGVASLVEILGTENFPRVKLGVRGERRDDVDLVEYVLQEFDTGELPHVEGLVSLGADAAEAVVTDGLEAAMGAFNARTATEREGDTAKDKQG